MSIRNKRAKDVVQEILGHVSFGQMLKAHRLGEELTQVEMAKMLEISRQELCDIEKDRKTISVERARKFAELLEYSHLVFAEYVLNDQLYKAGIDAEIELKKAV